MLEHRAEGGRSSGRDTIELTSTGEGGVLTYARQAGPRHGEESSSMAGLRRWMKAVAMMTPEPKYFAKLVGKEP